MLEDLAVEQPIARAVLDYRQSMKLRSTYVEALPSLIDPATGRIHAQFNQMVAATGRLSSSDPNLQNIPVRTPLGTTDPARLHRAARRVTFSTPPTTRRSNCGSWPISPAINS